MGMDNQAVARLPSLPQLLLRIVEAVHDENQGLPDLAAIIRQDAAVSARLLAAANSSFFNNRSQPCHTLERALLVLGLETVKTLVITAALQQFVGALAREHQAFLKVFWRRSLIAANFGQVLAGLTSYRNPPEAYLAGLLHEVGQLAHLNSHGDEWLELWRTTAPGEPLAALERARFRTDHSQAGALLIEQWQLPGFLADAIRFSREPVAAVRDAHHLVKITNLAAALASGSAGDDGCERAHTLFGLGDALTQELCHRIEADVVRLAQSMQIDIAADHIADGEVAHTLLGTRLGELNRLGHLSTELAGAQSAKAVAQAVLRTLNLTLDDQPALLFALNPATRLLTAHLPPALAGDADEPLFEIPLQPGRSLVADALLDRVPRTIDAAAPAVVDRQLLGLAATADLCCLPLIHEEQPCGVLVLGRSASASADLPRTPLLGALSRVIAAALARLQSESPVQLPSRLPSPAPSPPPAPAGETGRDREADLREAIHEAGNPLSIVRNYLEVLRSRLATQPEVQGELDLIRDEIDRVGAILLRLRDPSEVSTGEPVPIDSVIDEVARLFEQSLFAAHGIELRRHGSASQQMTGQPVELKQILVNLLKNAVEALPTGGRVEVESAGPLTDRGRHWSRIAIRDNGPGIPPALLDTLFQPVVSTKGGAGLGLSIVRRLTEALGGSVRCHSDSDGTTFELQLPWQETDTGVTR